MCIRDSTLGVIFTVDFTVSKRIDWIIYRFTLVAGWTIELNKKFIMTDITFPKLPFIKREEKPRETGINYVRAPVMVGNCIDDYLEAYASVVDIFKISGKQGAMMSKKSLLRFIETCKKHSVQIALGIQLWM